MCGVEEEFTTILPPQYNIFQVCLTVEKCSLWGSYRRVQSTLNVLKITVLCVLSYMPHQTTFILRNWSVDRNVKLICYRIELNFSSSRFIYITFAVDFLPVASPLSVHNVRAQNKDYLSATTMRVVLGVAMAHI